MHWLKYAVFVCTVFSVVCGFCQPATIVQRPVFLNGEDDFSYPHLFYNQKGKETSLVVFSHCSLDSVSQCNPPVLMNVYRYTDSLTAIDSFSVAMADCEIASITDDGGASIIVVAESTTDSFVHTGLFKDEADTAENYIPPGTNCVVFKYNLVEKRLEWCTPVKTTASILKNELQLEYNQWGVLLHWNSTFKFNFCKLIVNGKDTVPYRDEFETIAMFSAQTGDFTGKMDIKKSSKYESYLDFSSSADTTVYILTRFRKARNSPAQITLYSTKNNKTDSFSIHTDIANAGLITNPPKNATYLFVSYGGELKQGKTTLYKGPAPEDDAENLALYSLPLQRKPPVFLPASLEEYEPTLTTAEGGGVWVISEPFRMKFPGLYTTRIYKNGKHSRKTIAIPQKTAFLLLKIINNGYLYCYGYCEYQDLQAQEKPYYPFIFRVRLPAVK